MISQPLTISYIPINVTTTVWSSIWVLVSNDLLYFVGEFSGSFKRDQCHSLIVSQFNFIFCAKVVQLSTKGSVE